MTAPAGPPSENLIVSPTSEPQHLAPRPPWSVRCAERWLAVQAATSRAGLRGAGVGGQAGLTSGTCRQRMRAFITTDGSVVALSVMITEASIFRMSGPVPAVSVFADPLSMMLRRFMTCWKVPETRWHSWGAERAIPGGLHAQAFPTLPCCSSSCPRNGAGPPCPLCRRRN